MDIGEGAMVNAILSHDHDDCPFCKSDEDEKPENLKSNDDADWEEDDGALIDNNSGKLEQKMEKAGLPRPTEWTFDLDYSPSGSGHAIQEKDHRITPNPHHLIPGNEALKQVPDLLKWIFQSKGIITYDIGYDVNNSANGTWLPSNNSMRNRWTSPSLKSYYIEKAMDRSGGHFHDRHLSPYSGFVKGILQKIADRMWGIEAVNPECPFGSKTSLDTKGKYPPPFALNARLNGVSQRLAGHLLAGAKPTSFIYTSKHVLEYWRAKRSKLASVL